MSCLTYTEDEYHDLVNLFDGVLDGLLSLKCLRGQQRRRQQVEIRADNVDEVAGRVEHVARHELVAVEALVDVHQSKLNHVGQQAIHGVIHRLIRGKLVDETLSIE